ncbi:uncharacterized protein LOC116178008 [Photinus pyralis]|uniref:uncharacterized protein LOC116178008 n=1 Tax=Photinus pyralis TaxID=7054 RepID=UPI0012672E5F|nr:uncharacterized protein LOC116178008 [Photinus pyralis]
MFSNFTSTELAIIALALDEEDNYKTQSKKKVWVHNAWKSRDTEGEFITLYPHLLDDETKFSEYFRMTQATFQDLLGKVENQLKKQDTFWRSAIEPKQRLAVCLRFLATGDSFKTISFSFRLGRSTVQSIIHHTCRIIVDILLEEVMPVPNEDTWNTIADYFWKMWQFPNCIGALDGKHCVIQAPKNSGSLYWNYKKTFSLVLLALVDAQYNFIAVDVGAYGKNSDAGILSNSNLGTSLENGSINIPRGKKLPGSDVDLPMIIEQTWIMKKKSSIIAFLVQGEFQKMLLEFFNKSFVYIQEDYRAHLKTFQLLY